MEAFAAFQGISTARSLMSRLEPTHGRQALRAPSHVENRWVDFPVRCHRDMTQYHRLGRAFCAGGPDYRQPTARNMRFPRAASVCARRFSEPVQQSKHGRSQGGGHGPSVSQPAAYYALFSGENCFFWFRHQNHLAHAENTSVLPRTILVERLRRVPACGGLGPDHSKAGRRNGGVEDDFGCMLTAKKAKLARCPSSTTHHPVRLSPGGPLPLSPPAGATSVAAIYAKRRQGKRGAAGVCRKGSRPDRPATRPPSTYSKFRNTSPLRGPHKHRDLGWPQERRWPRVEPRMTVHRIPAASTGAYPRIRRVGWQALRRDGVESPD